MTSTVSMEELRSLLDYEGDLYMSSAAQPHIRSIISELIASRARIAELVGEVERAKRWADQAAQSASHWKIACFNAERELASLTGGKP